LANYDGAGGAWPKVETLASQGGYSERTVQRALKELKTLGEIVALPQTKGKPNRYRVIVRCPDACDRTSNHRVTVSPEGVTDSRVGGDCESPEPVSEPVRKKQPKTLLDPPDQAVAVVEPKDIARELAVGYWEWFKTQFGTAPTQAFMAIVGIFRKLLDAGWAEREVKLAAVEAGSPFTLRSMHAARVRLKCGQRGREMYRPVDPTKAAMDDGSVGIPAHIREAHANETTYTLTSDEVRELAGLPALGSDDGKP
jgi:AraC-like DNA-binding protein